MPEEGWAHTHASDRSGSDNNLAASSGTYRLAIDLHADAWREAAEDLDLDAGRLGVRQQYSRQGEKVDFGQPKTKAGRRSITLDSDTADALRVHRQAQVKERLLMGPAYLDRDLVFARPDGSPQHPDVISQTFKRLVRRSGLPPIRLHDLRHTCASIALKTGVHAKVVQERLGHSSIAVTLDLYSHVAPSLQQDAADQIGALLGRRRRRDRAKLERIRDRAGKM